MTDLRTAAQQALEAMEEATGVMEVHLDHYFEAMNVLRTALAQQAEPVEKARAWYTVDEINDKFAPPQQAEQAEPVEPVAWMVYTVDGKSVCVTDNPADFSEGHRALPLYNTPPTV